MDGAKIRLLFGSLPEGADPDDSDEREVLLEESLGPREPGDLFGTVRLLVLEALASQVVDEDPPEVWATAQRLLALGHDRRSVMRQLILALLPELQRSLDGKPFDNGRYLDALARLPLPRGEEIERALVEGARQRPGIDVGELEQQVADELGFDLEEEPYRGLVDHVSDAVIGDGPLVYLSGDRVVDPVALCSDMVLTHVVTEAEIATGCLSVGVDLAGFARLEEPLTTSDGMELEPFSVEEGHRAWAGPPGWLERFQPGTLLAVRHQGGAVSLEVLPDQPAPDEELVRLVAAAAEEELEGGLPAACEDLLLGMLVARPGCFSTPRPPLGELIEAAGLERRGGFVGDGPEVWDNDERDRRIGRLLGRFDAHETEVVLELVDAWENTDEQELDEDRLRHLLHELSDGELLAAAADELFGPDEEDRGRAIDVLRFAEGLSNIARTGIATAVAAWLTAVSYERVGEVREAEVSLHEALAAAPQWWPGIDRAAWYAFDGGRAEDALRLWRRIGARAEDSPEVALLESLVVPAGPEPGRNEPCWCGSGRKYKHCHLGRPAELALADRAPWLRYKALAYMKRRGGGPHDMVSELAAVRAEVAEGDRLDEAEGEVEDDALARALADGAVVDIALTEGGWFERFLSERGPLLPDDEALLAAGWALVPRSLYEVDEVAAQRTVLHDLRSGDQVTVELPPRSTPLAPGSVLCARAVPVDEDRHLLAGFAFSVPAGTEAGLFEVLDSGDPYELAAYLGARERPPRLTTREGEPMVRCQAVLEVGDPSAARAVLDQRYERDGEEDRWREMHELGPDDRILRATLVLEQHRITVETMSEQRLERVLDVLGAKLQGLRTVSVEREAYEQLRRRVGGQARVQSEPLEVGPAARAEIQERFEQRWCEESVPALGGLTPRQAAADPTRRETLERLLRDFEQHEEQVPAGAITMRSARLRELLGVPR